MAQYRAISRLTGIQNLPQEFGEAVDKLKRKVLIEMAISIAGRSPVDSGYYARNHTVALRSGSFTRNKARPDDVPRRSKGQAVDVAGARNDGLSKMLGEISGINIKSNNFVFRNPMLYAGLVEGKYGVYAQTRREMTAIVREAVQNIRIKGV